MNSMCKDCPVKPCETRYRGSICKARRAKLGLGDPMTNADRIRAMTDEELEKVINAFMEYFDECNRPISEVNCEDCELYEVCSLGEGKALNWLQQPAEGE